MRVCVIAAAVIALAQPALAARSHKKSSHRNHVAHLAHRHHAAPRYAASHDPARHRRTHVRLRRAPIESASLTQQTFGRTTATDRSFGDQFWNQSWDRSWSGDQSWQQAWTPSVAPQAAPIGGPAPRRRNARVHDGRVRSARAHHGALDDMIARHAAANGLPASLVHRVVTRESGYNPRARNGSNLGLMQIQYATARGVGYHGPASGLMNPETNLTYAVRYLAGAYRAAGGNASRAVALYASGYHGRGVRHATRVAMRARAARRGW
jgi:soluble lytic murein transglycosylase-like protein